MIPNAAYTARRNLRFVRRVSLAALDFDTVLPSQRVTIIRVLRGRLIIN